MSDRPAYGLLAAEPDPRETLARALHQQVAPRNPFFLDDLDAWRSRIDAPSPFDRPELTGPRSIASSMPSNRLADGIGRLLSGVGMGEREATQAGHSLMGAARMFPPTGPAFLAADIVGTPAVMAKEGTPGAGVAATGGAVAALLARLGYKMMAPEMPRDASIARAIQDVYGRGGAHAVGNGKDPGISPAWAHEARNLAREPGVGYAPYAGKTGYDLLRMRNGFDPKLSGNTNDAAAPLSTSPLRRPFGIVE